MRSEAKRSLLHSLLGGVVNCSHSHNGAAHPLPNKVSSYHVSVVAVCVIGMPDKYYDRYNCQFSCMNFSDCWQNVVPDWCVWHWHIDYCDTNEMHLVLLSWMFVFAIARSTTCVLLREEESLKSLFLFLPVPLAICVQPVQGLVLGRSDLTIGGIGCSVVSNGQSYQEPFHSQCYELGHSLLPWSYNMISSPRPWHPHLFTLLASATYDRPGAEQTPPPTTSSLVKDPVSWSSWPCLPWCTSWTLGSSWKWSLQRV